MHEKLLADLVAADPVTDREDAQLRRLVRQAASDARASANTDIRSASSGVRAPWWKRRRVLAPLVLGTLVAATGAAVLIPLQLSVNDTAVKLDAEIPIVYTTATGVEVTCRFGFYFGDPASRTAADEELADFVSTHDWVGVGQRIYEEAIVHPFVPGPDDDWEVDTQELRDQFSFNRAMSTVIWSEIPVDLVRDGQSSGSTSDCKGQLR